MLNFSTDTRSLQPGDIFIALSGENFDGHDFIDIAIEKGAKGLVLAKEVAVKNKDIPILRVNDTLLAYGEFAKYYRLIYDIPTIAITGSCGKTTVKEMLASILSTKVNNNIKGKDKNTDKDKCNIANSKSRVLANFANFNNEIGVPKTILQLNSQYKYLVLEMGARKPDDIAYLMSIAKPQYSVITNVAPCHLDTLGSLDGIAKAKGKIYSELPETGTAIINVDSNYAPYWLSLLKKQQKIVTFSLESQADISCNHITEQDNAIEIELVTDIGNIDIVLPTTADHNIINAITAAACARALNVELSYIKAGLERNLNLHRRMEVKFGYNGVKIIDDSYNANPVSMVAALKVLSKENNNKKIFVMGDMGEQGKKQQALERHIGVGQTAKDLGIDKLLGIGEFAKAAVTSFGENAKHYENKTDLIQALLKILDKDTTILVKGSNFMQLDQVTKALESIKTKGES